MRQLTLRVRDGAGEGGEFLPEIPTLDALGERRGFLEKLVIAFALVFELPQRAKGLDEAGRLGNARGERAEKCFG